MTATVYRRRLPHVRMDGAIYFVTWRVRTGQADLSADERDRTAMAIRHFDSVRYRLHAYVVMNDHVHVLVELLADYRLEEVIHSWKSYTANLIQREFGRQGGIWQEEHFDRVVRDDEEYAQKRDYILNNPHKRWSEIETHRCKWAVGL
jgi:REP element-mobilizing transposase RayT